jgi:hypothetical protein
MIPLAISVLWWLIGAIVILGIVWLALHIIKMFTPIPALVEKAIWLIVLILCLIRSTHVAIRKRRNVRPNAYKIAMSDMLHSHHGVMFAWRCARKDPSLLREKRMRRVAFLHFLRRVPIVRRLWWREPMDIMRAAAALREDRYDGRR